MRPKAFLLQIDFSSYYKKDCVGFPNDCFYRLQVPFPIGQNLEYKYLAKAVIKAIKRV